MRIIETEKLIKYVLKLLVLRDYFKEELILKLKVKGADSCQIEEVVKYVEQYNYLNDEKVLAKYVCELAGKFRGINYLKKKLFEKGCLKILNSYEIKKYYSEEMEQASALKFLEKNLDRFNIIEIKKKLCSRGYSEETVKKIIKEN